MSRNILIDLLGKKGVCTTSELVHMYRKIYPGKSEAAVRKLISRTGEISSLKLIRLPHNQSLIYTKSSFCSDFFWVTLIYKLYESSSVYYEALKMIEYFGGVILLSEFNVFSGVSNKQKNNVTNNEMLNNLLSSRLLKKEFSDDIGDYLIMNKHDDYSLDALNNTRDRFSLEKFIYAYVSEWMRRVCFVSYHKIKTKINSNENPLIGNTEWCLSAPSYIDSMRVKSSSGINPGFVVADILIQDFFSENKKNSTFDDVGYFLRKKEKLKNSNKNQRFMFFIFARSFSKDALYQLRSCGAIPITFSNMFGLSFSKEIIEYSNLIKKKDELIKNEETIMKMKKSFDSIYGELGQFNGFIFELFVGSFVSQHFDSGYVYYNIKKTIKLNSGEKKSAETDVLFETRNDIYCIECKNVRRLDDDEVDKWIDKRIPVFNNYFKSIENKKKIHHYLWVTGNISPTGLARLNDISSRSKKFEVAYKHASELFDYIKEKDAEYAKLYKEYDFLHKKAPKESSDSLFCFLNDDTDDSDIVF